MKSFSWFKALENKVSLLHIKEYMKFPTFSQTLWDHLGEKCGLSRNVVTVTDLWRHQKQMKGDQRPETAVISSICNPKNKVLLISNFHNFRKLMPGVFLGSFCLCTIILRLDFKQIVSSNMRVIHENVLIQWLIKTTLAFLLSYTALIFYVNSLV